LALHIAAELRAELGRQNRSRRWLAERIGHNHVTVSRWVNGEGGLTFDGLDAMCDALGISMPDLILRAEASLRRNEERAGAPLVAGTAA
jgi:DNA-binding Xre family transcriptional regulator